MTKKKIQECGMSSMVGGNSAHEPGADTRRGQAGKGLRQLLT